MDDDKDKHATLTIRAVASLSSLVAQLGGALIGLGAVAYVIGYQYLAAYYADDAHWVRSLYGAGDIIRAGAVVTSVVALGGLLTIMRLGAGSWTAAGLEKCVLILGAVGSISLALSFLPKTILPPSIALHVSLAGGVLVAASAGLDIGQLIARLKDSGIEWKSAHFDLLWGIYVAAIVLAPPIVGGAQAEIDFDPKLSKLPFVSKIGLNDQLRLVTALGDKLLVVSLSDVPEKRTYRLLTTTDGWTISKELPETKPSRLPARSKAKPKPRQNGLHRP